MPQGDGGLAGTEDGQGIVVADLAGYDDVAIGAARFLEWEPAGGAGVPPNVSLAASRVKGSV